MSKFKRLFWDLESAPNIGLFWKAGYKINIPPENVIREKAIICICWKWEGHRRVFSLVWNKGDDKAMVKKFLKVASEADELVAHNGNNFDLKWFNTQCLVHGLDPLPEPKTIDTLAIARKMFYMNSNKLEYLASLLLGEKKHSVNYQLWKDILLKNDCKALISMVDYCKQDVRLLERVYEKISMFSKSATHMGVFMGLPKFTCAHCGSENVRRKKRNITAMGTVRHSMSCKECHKHYTISDKSYRELEEC
jgi:hypothetical protein